MCFHFISIEKYAIKKCNNESNRVICTVIRYTYDVYPFFIIPLLFKMKPPIEKMFFFLLNWDSCIIESVSSTQHTTRRQFYYNENNEWAVEESCRRRKMQFQHPTIILIQLAQNFVVYFVLLSSCLSSLLLQLKLIFNLEIFCYNCTADVIENIKFMLQTVIYSEYNRISYDIRLVRNSQ